LLLLWLVLFTLLTPWVGDFADICRQLLPWGGLRENGRRSASRLGCLTPDEIR
jgi:hypothetical protein